jgi:hypothetical protein
MMGCYDFCGHYEWTFEWLRENGGEDLVAKFWAEAIGGDSQQHAASLIKEKGFAGMAEYWAHTLAEEAAGYVATCSEDTFRIDMHDCPSKGFLMRNNLGHYHDYCDHCIGWIGPVMEAAGFHVDHEHNHLGRCWWEFRRMQNETPPSAPGDFSGNNDVRLSPEWAAQQAVMDVFRNAVDASRKETHQPPVE